MRLFVAICFTDRTRKQLSAAVETLRTQGQGRFSPAENLHLTLAFLGETENADAALAALRQIDLPAFSLRFDGIGQFEDLYWAGIRENEALRALQTQLTAHLEDAGFVLEAREFLPHITLARRYTPQQDFSPVSIRQILSTIEEPVRELTLLRSHLRENGASYETLAVQPLSQK